jgi:hypothetical protein
MSDLEFTTADVKPKRGRPAKPDEDKVDEALPDGDSEKKEKEKKQIPEWSEDELMQVFDDIIFVGEYSEDVSIKGRLKVRFRTRTTKEIEAISRVLDAGSFNLVQTMEEARFLLNIQYALVSYQGRELEGKSIDERATFVRSLPGPVIGLLMTSLAKFDRKVFTACKDGEANF